MEQFLKNHRSPNPTKMKWLVLLTIKEAEPVIKNLLEEPSQAHVVSLENSTT